MELQGVCTQMPCFLCFDGGKLMEDNKWKSQATFICIKKEIEKLVRAYNLSEEQREQLEMNIAQKLGITVTLC